MKKEGREMLFRKKYLIMICTIVVLILIATSVTLLQSRAKITNINQLDTIVKKLNIALPESSKIINYTEGESASFAAKIHIENEDIENMKNELNKCFGKSQLGSFIFEGLYFENVYSWWDLEKDKIISEYQKYVVDGNDTEEDPTFSHDVYAFIAKDNKSQGYYLYVSY
ncbi:MAG: hypothetical protein Q8920_08465 [Bacillota bacterium]|nr:hypothetical protein [Bacillota bacterium]